jgi:hypothetical protein
LSDELIRAFATLPTGMASKQAIGLVMRGHISPGSGAIDQALEQVRGLWASRAAVGVDWHGVGVDASYPHVNDGRAVDAGHHGRPEVGDVGAKLRQIRAQIPEDFEAHREKASVGSKRDLASGEIVPPL